MFCFFNIEDFLKKSTAFYRLLRYPVIGYTVQNYMVTNYFERVMEGTFSKSTYKMVEKAFTPHPLLQRITTKTTISANPILRGFQ